MFSYQRQSLLNLAQICAEPRVNLGGMCEIYCTMSEDSFQISNFEILLLIISMSNLHEDAAMVSS